MLLVEGVSEQPILGIKLVITLYTVKNRKLTPRIQYTICAHDAGVFVPLARRCIIAIRKLKKLA
jgi:hypothetical protein